MNTHPPTTDAYEQKVYDYLNSLKYGESFFLNEKVEAKNLDKFTEIVKKYCKYHVEQKTVPYMNGIGFTNDYTEVFKK